MRNIFSVCKGCVFAKTYDGEQAGCIMNRERIFDTKVDGYYTLTRFCNAYRSKAWLTELGENVRFTTDEVRKEIIPRIGFVITFDNDLQALKNTLQSIADQTLQARYIVIINKQVEYNQEIFALFQTIFDKKVEKPLSYHIVQLIEEMSVDEQKNEAFAHALNGFIAFIPNGYVFEPQFIAKIDTIINKDLDKLVYIYDEIHEKQLIQAATYKFFSKTAPTVSVAVSIMGSPSDDPNIIRKWEEVFV